MQIADAVVRAVVVAVAVCSVCITHHVDSNQYDDDYNEHCCRVPPIFWQRLFSECDVQRNMQSLVVQHMHACSVANTTMLRCTPPLHRHLYDLLWHYAKLCNVLASVCCKVLSTLAYTSVH
jgi:hypothetical protein